MRTHLLVATAALITLTVVSTPRINGVTVTPPGQSASPQVLTVDGESFLTGLSLMITTPGGGSHLFKDTDIHARTETSFQVSMALAVAGAYSLVVTNPDGGMSGAFALTVTAPKASAADAPVIDSVTPSRPIARPDAQPLRVDGKRFVSGLVVFVTDPAGEVVTVGGGDVMDITPNSFRVSAVLSMEGQYTLSVKNPDGSVSNACTVTVTKAR